MDNGKQRSRWLILVDLIRLGDLVMRAIKHFA